MAFDKTPLGILANSVRPERTSESAFLLGIDSGCDRCNGCIRQRCTLPFLVLRVAQSRSHGLVQIRNPRPLGVVRVQWLCQLRLGHEWPEHVSSRYGTGWKNRRVWTKNGNRQLGLHFKTVASEFMPSGHACVAVACASSGNSLERTGTTDLNTLAKLAQSHRIHSGAFSLPSERVESTAGPRRVT